jgi:hypothetical protein
VSEEPTTPDREVLVRRSVEAFNRRDSDAGMTVYASNAVYDVSPLGLDAYESREEIRAPSKTGGVPTRTS